MRSFIVAHEDILPGGDIKTDYIFYGPFKAFKKADEFSNILEGEAHVIELKDPMKYNRF